MEDFVDELGRVLALIQRNDAKGLATVSLGRNLFNRRNNPILWRSLVEAASKAQAKTGGNELSFACAETLVKRGLSMDIVFDDGSSPLHLALHRKPSFAARLAEAGADPNVDLPKIGGLPLEILLRDLRARPSDVEIWSCAKALASAPKLNVSLRDQLGELVFAAIPSACLFADAAGAERAAAACHPFFKETLGSGRFDVNAPRYRKELGASLFAVATPLSYLLKWIAGADGARGLLRNSEVGAFAKSTAMLLMDLGADPTLQMEKDSRMELLDLCSRSGFPPGLGCEIEERVLDLEIRSAAPAKTAGRRSSTL